MTPLNFVGVISFILLIYSNLLRTVSSLLVIVTVAFGLA